MMRGQPPIFFRRTATGKGKGNDRKEDDTPIPRAATERIQPQPLLSAPSNLQAYKAATATEPSTHCVINDRNINDCRLFKQRLWLSNTAGRNEVLDKVYKCRLLGFLSFKFLDFSRVVQKDRTQNCDPERISYIHHEERHVEWTT